MLGNCYVSQSKLSIDMHVIDCYKPASEAYLCTRRGCDCSSMVWRCSPRMLQHITDQMKRSSRLSKGSVGMPQLWTGISGSPLSMALILRHHRCNQAPSYRQIHMNLTFLSLFTLFNPLPLETRSLTTAITRPANGEHRYVLLSRSSC